MIDWIQLLGNAAQQILSPVTAAYALAAIGLAIVVVYFRNTGTIEVEDISTLKG